MEWYTQQEVAGLLGVSKATVYHYAKQKKIIKIADPIEFIERHDMKKRKWINL
ncbi:helix-turn-helix domain-containing protein [Peribacillus frigoritolerans]|uniref:helix-turn-helix domain-containing protein n=1 Tax=Peribacillus frigoritolerans TaxID=450367 RepID=UPI003AB3B0FC